MGDDGEGVMGIVGEEEELKEEEGEEGEEDRIGYVSESIRLKSSEW